MSKAILEFDLTDPEDRDDFNVASQAGAVQLRLCELQVELRNIYRNDADNFFGQTLERDAEYGENHDYDRLIDLIREYLGEHCITDE